MLIRKIANSEYRMLDSRLFAIDHEGRRIFDLGWFRTLPFAIATLRSLASLLRIPTRSLHGLR